MVIYRVSKLQVHVMDPADGRIHNIPNGDFQRMWTGVLLLLSPGQLFEKGSEKNSVFRRFFYLLRPHRSVLVQVLVGALVYTVLGLATSIFLQKIIDKVLPNGKDRKSVV